MDTLVSKQIVRRARFLTQTLLLSGALNIGLLLAFFLLFVKEQISFIHFEHKPIEVMTSPTNKNTNAEVLKLYQRLSFEQLIAKMDQKELVEDGFSKRDLALGLLVSAYHFNLPKALSKEPSASRVLLVEQEIESPPLRITVYPGLADEDFQAIEFFAKREKWPLTTYGLFIQLQARLDAKEIDPALLQAFFLSDAFKEVEALLPHLDKQTLLKLLMEGDYKMLATFAEEQKKVQDLSVQRQQRFLLDFVAKGSKQAAEIMLQSHGAFAVKKLDDVHVIEMLQLLGEKTPHAEAFAKALLISPRSDPVWKLAAYNLYKFSGEEIKEPYDHLKALHRFIPQEVIKEKAKVAKAVVNKTTLPESTKKPIKKKAKSHVVEEGETLWLLAKKYKTDVTTLKKLNDLKGDTLKKGKTLKIS